MKIGISCWLAPFWALLILTLPVRFVGAIFVSGIVHECFHLIALAMFNVKVHRVIIGINGAKIVTESMTNNAELICAAAGPIGNFIIALFIKELPIIGVCSLVHGIFNCIPLGTMDGSRVLYCGLGMFLSKERVEMVYAWIQITLNLIFVFTAIYICAMYPVLLRYIPMILLIVIGKSPCKPSRKRVQYP